MSLLILYFHINVYKSIFISNTIICHFAMFGVDIIC